VIRLSQLIGQRVLTRGSGELIGSVRRVLLDPASGAITLAQLDGPAGATIILEWSSVVAVGSHAVMVNDDAQTRTPIPESDTRFVNGEFEVLGKTVLTDEGTSLGELADLDLNEVSGRVTRLHLPEQAVAVNQFVAVGPDAVIIPSAHTAAGRR
jgi:sporulation protein YlmC with PRC-barrel domain